MPLSETLRGLAFPWLPDSFWAWSQTAFESFARRLRRTKCDRSEGPETLSFERVNRRLDVGRKA